MIPASLTRHRSCYYSKAMAENADKGSRRRVWGTAIGALAGPLDTVILHRFGVSFGINGQDASWLIALYFGVSFALLGYLIGALMDSREREREHIRLVDEQRDLVNQTRARLAQSEKLAALGQMATMIAHEVRNPLGVMRSSAQEIRDSVRDQPNPTKATSFILNEIDRLNRVIESILGFARPIQPKLDVVRASDIATRAMLLAAEHPCNRDRRVRLDRGIDPEVYIDADLLTQVLLDLIANALEASPPKGDVVVEIQANGGVSICVSDSGPGVADEQRERIFEPFYTTQANGTGLGLAVSRQIVTSHGGSLSVGPSATGGARFEVRLPRHSHEIAA